MARDGQQTAERILQTAHQLFMERGYVGVSINDVVHAANITKPTLYYHYADKEALYAAVAEQALAFMGAELYAVVHQVNGTFEDQLTRLVEVIQGHSNEDFRMMRHQIRTFLAADRQSMLAQAFHRHMMQPVIDMMHRGQQAGVIHTPAATHTALLFLCHIEAFTGPEVQAMRLDIDARRIVQLFLYGVNYPFSLKSTA